jgi:hypothetical protein
MRGVWIAGLVAALALTIGIQTAMAEGQVAPRTDPQAESPAGVIYQIPLDSARRDAAPVLPSRRRDDGASSSASTGPGGPSAGSGGAGDGGASSGAGNAASNGSGSSASSGGTGSSSAGAGGRAAALSASADAGGGTAQNPSSIHSENGFGSASQVPGVSQAALRTGAGVAATGTAGSTTPIYLLIVLIAAAAIGMGLLATRHARRGDARPPTADG